VPRRPSANRRGQCKHAPEPCLSTIGHYDVFLRVSRIKQFWGVHFWHLRGMKVRNLTPKQLLSVPCPTCGVAIGARCLLHSGALRSEPHVDMTLAAADAVEQNNNRGEPGQ